VAPLFLFFYLQYNLLRHPEKEEHIPLELLSLYTCSLAEDARQKAKTTLSELHKHIAADYVRRVSWAS
jgi:hypothetical protein